jgi:LemA protein
MSAMILVLVLLGAVVLTLIVVIGIYNNLVTLRNRFKNAFAQIDVQLKRRYDLIPNLVESVKGYMGHERGTLEAVIAARTSAVSAGKAAAANPGDPTAMKALGGAEGALTASLGRLFAVAESYPDLKANQNMMALQEELASTENKIAFARQGYNDGVMQYNISREKFPSNIIAGMFNFTAAELLESTESPEERKAPKVSFS